MGASQLSCTDSPTALVCTSSSRKRHWDLWEAGSPGKPGDSRGEQEPREEASSSGLKGPLSEKGTPISTPSSEPCPPGARPNPEAGLGSHGGLVGQRSWGTEVAGPGPWGSGHEVSAERKEEGQLKGAGVWV